MAASKLPFHPDKHFRKADLEERSRLYTAIAQRVWDPNLLLDEAGIERTTAHCPEPEAFKPPPVRRVVPTGVRLSDIDLREARRPKHFDVLVAHDEYTETAPWSFEQKGNIRNAVVGQAYERAGIRYRMVTLEDEDEQVIEEAPVKRAEQQRSINPYQTVLRARRQHRQPKEAHSA